MPGKSSGGLYALSLIVLACGGQVDSGGSSAEPRPTQITPSSGYFGTPTPVVIAGTGFLVKTVQGAGGGLPTVDTTHRAWLGDTVDANELESVTWVNDAAICGTATPPCLTATVPAGLTPGLQALTVENAFGLRGRLENAFTVVSTPLGALSTTIAFDPSTPSTVSVGQAVTLTLTVTNTGSGPANVTAIEPSTTPSASATCGIVSSPGATPALPQTIASQASATFIWTCTPTAPGSLAMNATVTGTDAFTNQPLSATPATATTVTVQAPTVLTATITPSRTTVSGTQPVAITFRLTNGVTSAPAVITGISPSVTGNATCGEVNQSLPRTIPTNGYMDFTWTCTPSGTAGAITISGTANGHDGNDPGAILSATPATPATVTVQTPAALSSTAAVFFDATRVSVVSTGQIFTLTLNVTNAAAARGGASAIINGVTLNAHAPVECGAVGQTFPQTVAAGTTMAFTWNCSAATAASNVFVGGSASGQDFNTANPVSTSASTTVTIQTAATLTGVLSAPSPVSTGQSFTLTLTFAKGGTAQADVTAVTNPSGCVNPTPATRANVLAGQTITWTCTAPDSAQTLSLGTTVSWVDANNPAAILTLTPTEVAVTVQTAAAVTATSITAPATVNTGQTFTLTLDLAKTGTANANVTDVALNAAAAAICTGQNPATPVNNVGATQTFTWTCTAPGTAQSLSLNATATWVDVNVGTPQTVTPATAASMTVETAAAITVTSFALPDSVATGATFTVTMVVTNSGGATANNVVPTPTVLTPAPENVGTANYESGPASSPATILGGATATFTWSYVNATPGAFALVGGATGTDANSGNAITAPSVTSTSATLN